MEDDSPSMGRGAVYTASEVHELDASIMNGADRNCGPSPVFKASDTPSKSPARSWRSPSTSSAVTERIRHGPGRRTGRGWLVRHPKAHDRYLRALERDTTREKFGTVGYVAEDREGHLAAGTSTGA